MPHRVADRTILHVEDLEDNRGVVRQIVGRLGATLLEAVDGAEGVRLAKRVVPDLILMDLSLPVLDGWQAMAQLKAAPETMHIPVIALTAYATAGDEQRARTAGCDAYIAKPLDPSAFQQLLAEVLSGKPLR